MAFKLVEKNGHPVRSDIKHFDCTSVDDISKLPKEGIIGTQVGLEEDNEPCGIGSTALVKNGGAYKLFPDNEWAKI